MVDNCSKDDSVRYIEKHYPEVKIIKSDINNYCHSNNLAINKAKGKHVALINNDIKADKYWLKELVSVMESDRTIGAVGSKILFMDGRIQSVGHDEHPDFYWIDRGFWEKDKRQYDRIREVSSICACAVLYRKECLEDVGWVSLHGLKPRGQVRGMIRQFLALRHSKLG